MTSIPMPNRRHVRELDWLMLAVVALCCLGLATAVSVSGPTETTGSLGAMKSQGTKLLVGLVGFLFFTITPLATIRRLALPAFFVGAMLCYLPRLVGDPVNGAYRWLQVAGYSFQPVEFARFLMVIAIASVLARVGTGVSTFVRGFLPSMGCAFLLCGGLFLQPDHGNALIAFALAACMSLCAGVRFLHFAPFAAAGIIGFIALATRHDYVVGRLTDFLDVKPGTQVGQALVAIAAGGPFGAGIGQGWMKMGYVPEAQNDFVFAVVAEEFGYMGSLAVLALYTVIGVVGYRLVVQTRDPFHRFCIFGFTLMICMQAAMNLMVVSGCAPAKGIDLPFVSSGGTSILFCLSAIGIIGNAARSDAAAPAFNLQPGRL
ncbi:MAG: hypothetical protein RIT25_688 [Planctomycetota bacterium]|jgi:cell division protein FtsW